MIYDKIIYSMFLIFKNTWSIYIMGFIYKITNILTNKCYIGETKKNNPELRWEQNL